ncbi:MAG: hydroxymethylglutaryl-CoA lyase [bacterium]
MSWPARVRLVEVGPRDGLQNESVPVPTERKIEFIEALAASGLRDVEVTSFVRPDRVPQLADARELFAALRRREGVRYWALVPNARGLETALECGVTHVAVFTAASEGFNRANVNSSVEESLARLKPVVADAIAAGATVRGYVSTVFGCPYDGPVDPARAASVSRVLLDAGCEELSLGDTIGVAAPPAVERVLAAHDAMGVPREKIALHFHDTRGMAVANVVAGLEAGITSFDASAGGLGGCPFAPGATGNVATEDLVWLFDESGVECGVSFAQVAEASGAIGEQLGRKLPSRARAAWAATRMRGTS